MIHAVSGAEAMPRRKSMISPGNGAQRWRTDYFGQHGSGRLLPEPQAFLIDMREHDEILPHFHEVDQFQVFVAGAGSVGRSGEPVPPITVHYADRYTGYGPILSGPGGAAYFTLRARTDPGPVYLHHPGYRDKLKPSAKRHFTRQTWLSTPAVLCGRAAVSIEPLAGEAEGSGPGATMIRAGAGLTFQGPDPAGTGGIYLLVLQGSVDCGGLTYPEWSVIFLSEGEPALPLAAGSAGAELLALRFDSQND